MLTRAHDLDTLASQQTTSDFALPWHEVDAQFGGDEVDLFRLHKRIAHAAALASP